MQKGMPALLKQRVTRLSRKLRSDLLKKVRKEKEIANSEIRKRRNFQAQQRREEREHAKLTQKRFPKACRSIANLISLGLSKPVQEYIKLRDDFPFYSARRPSGEAWDYLAQGEEPPSDATGTRDAVIVLHEGHIEISYGSESGHEYEDAKIPYQSSQKEIEELLDELSDNWPTDARLAINPKQFKLEWHPEQVAYQVLVDCADRRNLEFYLRIALNSPDMEMEDE